MEEKVDPRVLGSPLCSQNHFDSMQCGQLMTHVFEMFEYVQNMPARKHCVNYEKYMEQ